MDLWRLCNFLQLAQRKDLRTTDPTELLKKWNELELDDFFFDEKVEKSPKNRKKGEKNLNIRYFAKVY